VNFNCNFNLQLATESASVAVCQLKQIKSNYCNAKQRVEEAAAEAEESVAKHPTKRNVTKQNKMKLAYQPQGFASVR